MNPKARICPVFVPHLGCPHRCVFCDQNRISGSGKPADAEAVRRALEAIRTPAAETELAFYGGSFTAVPESLQQELLDASSEHVAMGGSIRVSTRPDAVSERNLEFLKVHGVRTVELGCQSMDEGVLLASGRGHTAEDVRKAAREVRKAGLRLILQMMTGLPEDTLEKSLHTAQELAVLQPDGVRIYPTVILKGTRLHQMWLNGQYREHTVEEAASWCADILPVFESRGIPVIRLGLNPSEELSGGQAVGGAYHPAFGQVVASLRFLEEERRLLREGPLMGTAQIVVHPSCLSAAVGHGSVNRKALEREYPGLELQFVPSESLPRDGIAVEIRRLG